MKILLCGSSSTLASSIILSEHAKKNELILISRRRSLDSEIIIDISNFKKLSEAINSHNPDIIFQFAAETNVDLCEVDKLLAINNNYVTTKNLVDIAKELQIPLVFTSSASIFEGKDNIAPKEYSQVKPSNFYAFTKLLSEDYIVANLKKYYIIRFGWLAGNPVVNHKFFGNVYRRIKNKEREFYGVNDQFGSITFADKFVDFLFKLIEKEYFGIYNFASKGYASRYQILREILNYLSIEQNTILNSVSLKHFELTAKRPEYEVLDIKKVKDLKIVDIDHWIHDLKNYLIKYDFFR